MRFWYLVLLLSASCATAPKSDLILFQHKIGKTTINIVKDHNSIAKVYGEKEKAYAFHDPKTNTIWVPENDIKDENGEVMPNLFLLGHEIWHVIKPNYHSQTNFNYSYPVWP